MTIEATVVRQFVELAGELWGCSTGTNEHRVWFRRRDVTICFVDGKWYVDRRVTAFGGVEAGGERVGPYASIQAALREAAAILFEVTVFAQLDGLTS